jgi:exodeoxyribonuclease V gamma subunit
MGLSFFVSNDLYALSDQLADVLRKQKQGVFVRHQLVTQTEGMNNWLKVRLASKLGIVANVNFPKPNDVVMTIRQLLAPAPAAVLNQDFMRWRLFSLLGTAAFQEKFPDVAVYYRQEEIKRVALSSRLADLFDQYQVYRTETISRWNKNESGPEAYEQWQQWLWYQMREDVPYRMQDRTELVAELLQQLNKTGVPELLKEQLPAVHFFGLAVITPYYMNLFHALSAYIDVNFYLMNPAPEQYWFDYLSEQQIARKVARFYKSQVKRSDSPDHLLPGNSLLLNMGVIVKNSFRLLFQNDVLINIYDYVQPTVQRTPHTLLEKIQDDIFQNALPSGYKFTETDRKDGSVTVNSCFTPLREVEVLYNYLVELIDSRSAQLSPQDIVVMVTDIDTYAPYIRAVFESAKPNFPINIADESLSSGNNLFSALRLILEIDAEKFTAESVLEILESPLVRMRTGISDLEQIRMVVRQAAIRFGQDGDRELETHLYSWTHGLKRIIYGICIGGSQPYFDGTDEVHPLDSVEGNGVAEIIRFYQFVKTLTSFVNRRKETRRLDAWVEYLYELVDALIFRSGEKELEDYHRFVRLMETMTAAEATEEISFEVIRHSLQESLTLSKRSHAFSSGGVTFCSLIPMRSIPAKVIAMLGMNFDAFPRRETKLNFSLFARDPLAGDRNVRENDRHLFLETILSAKQYLYLSYIGGNVKDGSEVPPASTIDELLDYIIQSSEDSVSVTRKQLITIHPLHGHSRKYFDGKSGLRTYLGSMTSDVVLPKRSGEAVVVEKTEPIKLKSLADFWRDPVKWYVNNNLQIYYRDEEILLPEMEAFEVGTLENWKLKEALLFRGDSAVKEIAQEQKRDGNLPLRNLGEYFISNAFKETKAAAQTLKELTEQQEARILEINLLLDGVVITGNVNYVYGERMVIAAASKSNSSRAKRFCAAMVEYLAAVSSGEALEFYFIENDGDVVAKLGAGGLSAADAGKVLKYILSAFIRGQQNFYPFIPFLYEELFANPNAGSADFIQTIQEDLEKSNPDYWKYKSVHEPYFMLLWDSNFFTEQTCSEILTELNQFFGWINTLMPGAFTYKPKK